VDATVESGFRYTGTTYAAAAADVDRDGWIDLAVSNHHQVRLFKNLGDGTFSDQENAELSKNGDTHGVAWLDLDDNGMWDLFVSIGAARGRGAGANRVYLNHDGILAAVPEVDPVLGYPRGRGRCVCPVDFDLDGQLDLAVMNAHQPDRGQRLARRQGGGFVDVAPESGWADVPWECAVVMHVDESDQPVYVAGVASGRQPRAYRYRAAGYFEDVTEELGLTGTEPVSAMVPGDFDNDGDLDLYLVTGGGVPEGVETSGDEVIFRMIAMPSGVLKGFRFRAGGRVDPAILLEGRPDADRVFLGQSKVPLADSDWGGEPDSPHLVGRPDLDPESDRGVFLWRDDAGDLILRFSGQPSELWEASGRIGCEAGIEVVERSGLIARGTGPRNHLFENRGGRFIDVTETAGVAGTGSAVDAAFADFDNDGDLDLFVVNGREPFHNPGDTVYRNDGDGTFTDVSLAAGLDVPVDGRGDGIVVFDSDRDGDLDVFTTNGRGPPPGNEGPYQLWINESETGNWAVVGLEGAAGNRPAFGTRLTADIGGRPLRLGRFAATGRFSTSILPIHIGLGRHDEADLHVVWPSGAEQHISVGAGEALTLREPMSDSGGDG
jgi:hypothetical protein